MARVGGDCTLRARQRFGYRLTTCIHTAAEAGPGCLCGAQALQKERRGGIRRLVSANAKPLGTLKNSVANLQEFCLQLCTGFCTVVGGGCWGGLQSGQLVYVMRSLVMKADRVCSIPRQQVVCRAGSGNPSPSAWLMLVAHALLPLSLNVSALLFSG